MRVMGHGNTVPKAQLQIFFRDENFSDKNFRDEKLIGTARF
jgi:hypothetical protein